MLIEVRSNFPELSAKLARLQDDLANQVLARSLNRTVEQARTQMSREIRTEYNLDATYVRERLSIKRAFARGGQFAMTAELRGGGKRRSANVIRFVEGSTSLSEARNRAKQGTLGRVFVRIKRGAKKPLNDRSFIGNKGRTVFERVAGTTMKARQSYAGTKHGEAIKPVQTIDVGQMFNAKRINAAVVAAINARFPAIFKRELAYAISKAGL